MLNFDEEIKKFHPSLEVEDIEKAVKKESKVQDLTDLMLEIMEGQNQ